MAKKIAGAVEGEKASCRAGKQSSDVDGTDSGHSVNSAQLTANSQFMCNNARWWWNSSPVSPEPSTKHKPLLWVARPNHWHARTMIKPTSISWAQEVRITYLGYANVTLNVVTTVLNQMAEEPCCWVQETEGVSTKSQRLWMKKWMQSDQQRSSDETRHKPMGTSLTGTYRAGLYGKCSRRVSSPLFTPSSVLLVMHRLIIFWDGSAYIWFPVKINLGLACTLKWQYEAFFAQAQESGIYCAASVTTMMVQSSKPYPFFKLIHWKLKSGIYFKETNVIESQWATFNDVT